MLQFILLLKLCLNKLLINKKGNNINTLLYFKARS